MTTPARIGVLAALLLAGVACAPCSRHRPRPDPGRKPAAAAAVAAALRPPPSAPGDRIVRLQVRGLAGVDYRLQAACESGRAAEDIGHVDGGHVLHLPPGPCVLTVTTGAGAGQRRFEHVFTVTEEPEQHVVFAVVAGDGD